mmetsp:Transcript_21460/g.72983  ORF Transcript_21460/g.72983 Transcript_21460/m.72983 type:complete len:315 (-) Transcript_21460:1479-2423(-)
MSSTNQPPDASVWKPRRYGMDTTLYMIMVIRRMSHRVRKLPLGLRIPRAHRSASVSSASSVSLFSCSSFIFLAMVRGDRIIDSRTLFVCTARPLGVLGSSLFSARASLLRGGTTEGLTGEDGGLSISSEMEVEGWALLCMTLTRLCISIAVIELPTFSGMLLRRVTMRSAPPEFTRPVDTSRSTSLASVSSSLCRSSEDVPVSMICLMASLRLSLRFSATSNRNSLASGNCSISFSSVSLRRKNMSQNELALTWLALGRCSSRDISPMWAPSVSTPSRCMLPLIVMSSSTVPLCTKYISCPTSPATATMSPVTT